MKKNYLILFSIMLCLLFSGCTKEYTPPDLNNLTPEQQQQLEDFQKQTLGNLSEEENKELHDKYNYIAAIARDISKKYIVTDSDSYEFLTIKNKGSILIDSVTYARIDLEADDVYVKSILINVEENIYKLYDKNNDKVEDLKYNAIGHFVRNLGPWVSTEQVLASINNSTPQRIGTSAEIYRETETNEFKISIQTYLGFENIATANTTLTLENDKKATFTFENDGYGHSGSGSITYISEEEMILEIKVSKPETEFGIESGIYTLQKNKV